MCHPSPLPPRLVLPSPWLTSQASPLCLLAQGRPTTTCAASTPAPWSAPWWRLKVAACSAVYSSSQRSQQYLCHAAVRCPSPANLRLSSSCPALSTLHQMKNSCLAQDFILPVKDKCALWKTEHFATKPEGPPFASFLNFWAYIETYLRSAWVTSKWHFSWLNGSRL